MRLGAWGEQQAADFYLAGGDRILARNWRSAYGEIDLVVEAQGTIVFVEVKTRASTRFGSPEAAITAAKQQHLRAAACAYLDAHQLENLAWRIDVVAIEVDRRGKILRFDHYPDAVGSEDQT